MQFRYFRIYGCTLLLCGLCFSLTAAETKQRTYQPPTLKRSVVHQAQRDPVRRSSSEPRDPSIDQPLVFDSVMGEAAGRRSKQMVDRAIAPVVNIEESSEAEVIVPHEAQMVLPSQAYPAYTEPACGCGEPICGCDAACGIELACGCDGPVCGCDAPITFDSGCDSMFSGGDVCFDGGCDSADCGCGVCALCIFDLVCIDVRVPTKRLYGSGEILLWWQRGESLPVLATSSNDPNNTAFADAGVIGVATTTTLFGGTRTDSEGEAGGRITIGRWLDDRRCRALEFRYWGAGEQDFGFSQTSDGSDILARPFFAVTDNVNPGNASQVIAFPNELSGSLSVSGRADMHGVDVLLRRHLSSAMNGRIDLLWGYQMSQLDSAISIASQSTVISNNNALPQGSTIDVLDQFATENEFHGAAFGVRSLHRHRRWSFGTMFKIAFGGLQRDVFINGSTTTTSAGTTNTVNEGLLAQSTNIGASSDTTFAVLPEINLTLGYRIRRNIDFTFGYNYLMMNKVTQPWRTIDPSLAANLANPPTGQQRPGLFRTDGPFWIQGINFGLACKY